MALEHTIDTGAAVIALPIAPGESVVVRGVLRVASQNAWVDACHEGREGQSGALGLGAFDLAGGGLVERAHSQSEHSCRVEATGQSAPACRAAGVEGPCLALRLRAVAHGQAVPMSYEELRRELTGGLSYEVVAAAGVAPIEQGFFARSEVRGGALGVLLVGAAVGAWWARARKSRAEGALAEVRRVASRVRGRLGRAQPVLARMAPRVDALIEALSAQGTRAARDAGAAGRLEALRLRAAELRGLETHARSEEAAREHAEAGALVAEQVRAAEAALARTQAHEARVRRVREYLLTLDARLDEAERAGGQAANEDDERLRAAFDDVEAAFEGAREVEAVVSRRVA